MTAALAELKALMLLEPKLSVAAAESLTSGRVQSLIGAVSGASEFFRGGLTAYSIEAKVKLLGVDRASAEAVNAVSAAVAEQMAAGACQLFASDLAVATTGYAEPSPPHEVAVPFAYWAVAHRPAGGPPVLRSGRVDCPARDRPAVQQAVAEVAVRALLAVVAEIRSR
jgi:nicotinamide-nucleotide amidase